MTIPETFFVSPKTPARDVMKMLDTHQTGVQFVVDAKKRLLGIATSGDIRRAIDVGFDSAAPIRDCMNRDPLTVSKKNKKEEAISTILAVLQTKEEDLEETLFSVKIPVLNEKKEVQDLIEYRRCNDTYTFSFGLDSLPSTKNVERVLIVGGAGYLGSCLTRQLLEQGYAVRVLDSLLFGNTPLAEFLTHPQFEFIQGDARDIQVVHKCLKDADAVVHLAAIVGDPASKKQPQDTIAVNYLASMILALACKYYQINRFIFASTCSVYGVGDTLLDEDAPLNPVSLYARTKIESEKGILSLTDSNFKPVVMRMSTLYGLSPRMRFDLVVNTFAKMATVEKKIKIFGGKQWRPLLHVEDAARAYVLALQAPLTAFSNNQVFNVGSKEQNYTIEQLGAFVTSVMPDTDVSIEADETGTAQDPRTYKVSFARIQKTLGYTTTHTVKETLSEIQQAIVTKKIPNVDDPIHYNYIP